ncbi:MAG: hypothetical protein NC089_12790 [Bacteroides sp.]|nr:hypothetical protein [Bacteroides sp.]
MGRKSIFEQLSDRINFLSEIQRIDKLIKDKSGINVKAFPRNASFYQEPQIINFGIENFVDMYMFKSWKGRGTCVDCNDMLETLGLKEILKDLKDITENDILNYLEYAANILRLAANVKLKDNASYNMTDVYYAALDNVNSCLNWLNFETKVFSGKDIVLVVEKNTAATSVAEFVDEELAYSIISYNHFLLKGNIAEKRKILLKLANEIEPKRRELEKINYKLADNIFFMLNNLNIRHNNRSVGDKNYKEYIAKMKKSKLEEWYDEVYQEILLAYLLLDDENRKIKIEELKKKIAETHNKQIQSQNERQV